MTNDKASICKDIPVPSGVPLYKVRKYILRKSYFACLL